MIKKSIALALSIIMFTILAACGANGGSNSAGTSDTGGKTANAGKKVTIKYWYAYGGKVEEAKKHLTKQFNESQDRYEVIAEHQGGYDDLNAKVQAAFAAGNAPAVSDLQISSTSRFARSGMLLELTSFANRDKDEIKLNDFNPGLMGDASVDGKLYGLPFMRSTPILYKNVTMLKEAGLDPQGPKTWSELEQYSRTLKSKGKLPMTIPVDIWYYEALVAQSGGQMLTADGKAAAFNSPEGIAPVEFWGRMAKDKLFKFPVGDEAESISQKDWANQSTAFLFSTSAGMSAYMEVAKGAGFEMDAAFLPANKSYGLTTGGAQLVITSKLSDEEKEAAWAFVKFMTSKENTIYVHKQLGYLPTRLSAIETEEMKEQFKQNPLYKVAVDQLAYAKPRPMENAYPEVVNILKSSIEKAIIDPKVTPQDAINEAAEKANKLLKK